MNIIPIEGLGIVITGPPQKNPVEIWGDGLVTLTRLPGGRCLIPMTAGPVRVVSGGKVLAEVDIAAHRVAEPGDGRFTIKSAGTICVWPFYAELDGGLLAGEEPSATAEHTMDLSKLNMPHRLMTLAVQVVGARRVGPVRFFSYRPDAAASPVSIDHANGRTGPVTHVMVDSLGLPGLQIEVTHRVRQTGKSRQALYEISSPEDRITFENLLHGDQLSIAAGAPFALAGTTGPVQGIHYKYRAVPEPRLERQPREDQLEATGGLTALGPEGAVELLGTLTGTAPTWRQEYPTAGSGVHATLVAAVKDKLGRVKANIDDARELAWWVGALESGQDVRAAAHLRDSGIDAAPGAANEIAAAIMFLDSFPAHLFKELGAPGPGDAIMAFQESRGFRKTDGGAAVDLAGKTIQALEQATVAWREGIQDAGLDWIDGALPPLVQSTSIADLAELLRADPKVGMQELWERRRRIWQVVPSSAGENVDLTAREALLGWHLQRTEAALNSVADLFGQVGIELAQGSVREVPELAKRLGELTRAAEPAVVRVGEAPLSGSRFVERAAARAADTIDHIHGGLTVWTAGRVPAGVRLHAGRAVERWNRSAIAKAEVWATFLAQNANLQRDLAALDSEGTAGARRLAALLQKAVDKQDPAIFAQAQSDLAELEEAMSGLHTDWAKVIQKCSVATRDALQLSELIAWDVVRERVDRDFHEISKIAAKLVAESRTGSLDDDLTRLRRAANRVGEADPESMVNALLAYDHARVQLANDTGGDPRLALVEAHRRALVKDLHERIEQYIGEVDDSTLAALAAFKDISGATELRQVLKAVASEDIDASRAEQLHARLDNIQEGEAAWERICASVEARLWPLRAEITRYMGPAAPRWSLLGEPSAAIRWLHAMSAGDRDEPTDSDPAILAPGNRRLLEHTLKNKGLWIP